MEKYYENKRLVLASLITIGAVGTAGYLWYSSRSGEDAAASTPSGKSKSKSKSKNNKKKKSGSKKNPLSHGFETARDSPESPLYPVIDDWDKVEKLGETERRELAEELKLAGNVAFTAKKFDQALDMYTQAIKCYNKDAIYYSNRAAVWGSLKDYENVIKDTNSALKLRPDYIKCYTRRAVGYEHLKNFREAVMDYTAACILQNFEDDNVGNSVDRTLKAVAEQRVEKEGNATKNDFPSANFIRAYLQSYHRRELPEHITQSSEEGSSDYELKLAFDAIAKENQESYKQAYEHIKKAIEIGFASTKEGKESEALAYEYLATFEFLCNESDKALQSINHSLSIQRTVSAYLKRSAIHIEGARLGDSEADFERARALDPENPDIYYQLAQVSFLQSEWTTAAENYKRSIALDDSFILAHIQLAVTEYRQEKTEAAKKRFVDLIKKYPNDPFVYNYYGEILLDLKDIDGAIKMFDKAFELEKSKSVAAINVLPLVNKSLAVAQRAETPADIEKAVNICEQAFTIDPLSDVAVGTLAQYALQQGRTTQAIELFEKNAKLARTLPEQIQAYTFAEAARTQYRIALERPVVRTHLEALSRSRR